MYIFLPKFIQERCATYAGRDFPRITNCSATRMGLRKHISDILSMAAREFEKLAPRRDPDPLCSAQNLLSENTDIMSCLYRVDNVRGLHIVRVRGRPANSINRPTRAETRNPDTSTRRDLSAFEVVLSQETQRRRSRAEHEAFVSLAWRQSRVHEFVLFLFLQLRRRPKIWFPSLS
jgi:hypothetical protein